MGTLIMNNEENNASRLFTDNEWPRILNIVYTGPAWWEESESPHCLSVNVNSWDKLSVLTTE